MVDINSGDLYITTGTVSGNTITGGTTIRISSVEINYNLENNITVIPIAISPGNRGTKVPHARVVDLKRITESITVKGELEEETDKRAIEKRDDLITLYQDQGALTVVWGRDSHQTVLKPDSAATKYGMFINKMGFTEQGGYTGTTHTSDTSGSTAKGERQMSVIVTLVRGKDTGAAQ